MQKSKHKLILFSLLALSIVIGVLTWRLDYVQAESDGFNFINFLGDIVGEPLAMNIGALIVEFCRVIYDTFIQPILMPIIVAMLHFGITASDILINGTGFGGVEAIWGQLLGIANGVYLLALFIASIAIILRVNVGIYNVKKFLGGFITAVILSNLSLYIVRAVWSIGELFVNALLKMAETLTPLISNRVQIEEFLRTLADQVVPSTLLNTLSTFGVLLGTFMMPGVGIPAAIFGMNIYEDTNKAAIVAFVVLLVCIWFVLKLALVLFERVIRLFLLAITAPVIFALGLLPNFSKLTGQWWENLIKWVLVWPAVLALIIFSAYMLSFAGITKPEEADRISLWLNPPVIAQVVDTGGGLNTEAGMGFMGVLLALFALWTAGMMNKTLNLGSVIAGHVESPQKALQTGQGLYKKGADILTGKAAGPTKFIQDTMAGKNLVGMAGLGLKRQALAGKLGGKHADWIQEKTANLQAGYNERTFATQGAKKEAAAKKAVVKAAGTRGAQQSKEAHTELNKIAQQEYGTDYFDLSKDQQKAIKRNNRSLVERYDDASGSALYNIGQSIKDEDPSIQDSIAKMAADTETGNSGKGDLVQAKRLVAIAINKNHPDREAARDALIELADKGVFEDKFGMDRRKFARNYIDSREAISGSLANSEDLVAALSRLTNALTTLGVPVRDNTTANMTGFAEATKDANNHDMAIALRKLANQYGVNADSSPIEVATAITDLANDGGEGTEANTISALRSMVKSDIGLNQLAESFGNKFNTDTGNDETKNTTLQEIIANIKQSATVVDAGTRNINTATNNAFQASIKTYMENKGITDIDELRNEIKDWVQNVGNTSNLTALPKDTTARDAGVENAVIRNVLDAFGANLVGKTLGGPTPDENTITIDQLTTLLAKANHAADKMK